MKKHLSTIVLVLIFIIGLSLLLYPSFSDWWNSWHATRVIESYTQALTQIDNTKYWDMINAAVGYNQRLARRPFSLELSDEERREYEATMDIDGTGIMGYVEIPSINVKLPIYHGTSDGVLQVAVGHIEGTSLPVGGDSSHCVISGHRGLPSARLFTDIDQLVRGDEFSITTLEETYYYEVDQIQIVLPYDMDYLQITPGKDYCTLVTCTPYGVNTHRLLVRGVRVGSEQNNKVRVSADAVRVDNVYVAVILGAFILTVLVLWLLISDSIQKRKKARGN